MTRYAGVHKLGPGTRLLPFWDRVDRGPIDDINDDRCWEWMAGSQQNRRARMRFGGRDQYVYRIAWQLALGPIPPGVMVCHHCDNPLCCRPSHLFLGSQKDNMRDGFGKGRVLPPTNGPKGEGHHSAKLTVQQVREIRELGSVGASQRRLAGQFGVSQHTIANILHRRTWKDVA